MKTSLTCQHALSNKEQCLLCTVYNVCGWGVTFSFWDPVDTSPSPPVSACL